MANLGYRGLSSFELGRGLSGWDSSARRAGRFSVRFRLGRIVDVNGGIGNVNEESMVWTTSNHLVMRLIVD